MAHDETSALFFCLVFMPCFLGIPLLYALYVLFDIWRRKLLPPVGRRGRTLSLFLLRLVFIYFILWSPFLLFCSLGTVVELNSWIFFSGAVFAPMQGICTALFCMGNGDIREAVISFVTCQRPGEELGGCSSSLGRLGDSFSRLWKIEKVDVCDVEAPTSGEVDKAPGVSVDKDNSKLLADMGVEEPSDEIVSGGGYGRERA
jgi:hypothetical protein